MQTCIVLQNNKCGAVIDRPCGYYWYSSIGLEGINMIQHIVSSFLNLVGGYLGETRYAELYSNGKSDINSESDAMWQLFGFRLG